MVLAPGSTLGPYEIVSQLGSGGMGVVYRAIDPRLKRTVAIKLLPSQLSQDATAKQRLLQEAQAASALDHPNICTIHEINETADGQLYLVMAHYEGETLKERISRGPLELSDAIDIAMQVGQGLVEAHNAGIVHRDIKPANLLITTTGVVRILDFGLAKLEGSEGVTQTGTTVGTVAYMSPEQARGETVDHRTDIWSFGVVFYEMLAGELPFQGENLLSLADAIRTREPAPLSAQASTLNAILRRTLRKDPGDRYHTMNAVLRDLRSGSPSPQGADQPASPRDIPSIAVLPFADMSRDKDQEYFCEGIAEELIDVLARLEGLHVVARTSAFQFKAQAVDLREVGEKLNVRSVLEGSVRKSGERLRINVQLVNASDGYHIWSERFDRELSDVFAVQDDIARAVVERLEPTLLGTAGAHGATTRPSDQGALRRGRRVEPAAHEAYLRGRFHAAKRQAAHLQQAVDNFEEALRLDPLYAAAHAGLADCLTILATSYEEDLKPLHQRANAAAAAAVELDPLLSDGHAALGYVRFRLDWAWDEAGACFARALQLNPGHAPTYLRYAQYLIIRDQKAEAIAAISRALEFDPVSLTLNAAKGRILHFAREHILAVEQFRHTQKLDPSFLQVHLDLAFSWAAQGDYDRAVAEVELGLQPGRPEWSTSMLALFEGLAGRRDRARERMTALETDSTRHTVRAFHFGMIHFGLGEYDRALDYFEQACDARDPNMTYLPVEPVLDPLRSHSRFRVLLQRMNLARPKGPTKAPITRPISLQG